METLTLPVANRRLTCLGNNTVEVRKATCCLVRKKNSSKSETKSSSSQEFLNSWNQTRPFWFKRKKGGGKNAMKRSNLPPSMGLNKKSAVFVWMLTWALGSSLDKDTPPPPRAPCLVPSDKKRGPTQKTQALNLTWELIALGDAKNRDKCHSRSSQRVAKHTQSTEGNLPTREEPFPVTIISVGGSVSLP